MSGHAWGDNRILTFLKEGRRLYDVFIKEDDHRSLPPPRFISCWISEKCNLDCSYCWFADTNADKSHQYIDKEVFLRWLTEAQNAGAEALEFSGGGEPTLHPDFKEIYERAYGLGYALGIITHACNQMPLESMADHFKYVRCGLDAATAETHDLIKRNKRKNYWFHRAIENIKEMVRLRNEMEKNGIHSFSIGIKIVLNSINYHELNKMISLAYSLCVDYIQIKREHSSDNDIGPEQMESAEKIILKSDLDFRGINARTKVIGTMSHARATTKCFMSPIHTVVTATGKILQCCFFENRPIGNISKPFMESWGSEQHREVIKKTTVQECDKVDCRWNIWNRKMKEIIEDPLHQASFI